MNKGVYCKAAEDQMTVKAIKRQADQQKRQVIITDLVCQATPG